MSLEHQLPVLVKKTQMSGERAQCGLTSLLPMSCRGRAEAFARRLHTRLRSLGAAGSAPDPAESRWLGAAAVPRRDSDLFYDFELECESPSSPVDEFDAPFRETSPADESDAPFYDVDPEPEREARDELQSAAHRVPAGAPPPHRVSAGASPPHVNGVKFSSAFYADRSPIQNQPTPRENGFADGRLYSAITFDDCERVEPPLRSDVDEADAAASRLLPAQLPLLHSTDSDSDFESAKSDIFEIADEAFESKQNEDAFLKSDSLSELSIRLEDPSAESNHIEIAPIVLEKTDDIEEESKSENEDCNHVGLEIKTEESAVEKEVSPAPEQDPTLLQAQTELEPEEEDRPQRVRRCSSLKTGKTPPGTPGRKKIVRFADVLGLDLADVKTFMDEIPVIPKSAYEDLANADFATDFLPPRALAQQRPGGAGSGLSLVPLFQTARDMTEGLEARCVCLESARVADGAHIAVGGSVRVRNLDFHKTVHVRYTMDGWRTYTDLQATYVQGSCDGFSDRFTFMLYTPAIAAGQRLEIAVRFQCKGRQYWDNNFGVNYCFDCLPLGVPVVASLSSSPLHPTRDWHPSFY